MSATTMPLGNRVDVSLKREFDATAEEIGLTPTAALTVFMKRFVAEGGFPFAVRKPRYNDETEAAIAEARAIMSGKLKADSYDSFDDLLASIDD